MVGVFFRYILNDPLYWAEEAARLLLIWLSFVGAALGFQRCGHISMNVVVRRFSRPVQDRIEAVALVLGIAFCVTTTAQTVNVMISRWTRESPVMGWPYLVFALPLAIGMVIGTLYLGARLWSQLRAWPRALAPVAVATAALCVLAWLFPAATMGALRPVPPLFALFLVLAITLCLNMPIALSLGMTALVYLLVYSGLPLAVMPQRMLAGVDSFVLLAVPLFIVGGALMEAAGISQRIVDLAMVIVGRMRGGLGQVVVITEILFSGISGSVTADIAAVGSLLIPSMKRTGYRSEEAASIICAAAAMGILIPPSVHMIVLGTLVNVSVAKMFVAGFLPAFFMAAGLMLLIYVKARRGNWARATERVTAGDFWRACRRAVIPLMTPVIIFGGIFSGATTVTESAVLAVAYSVVVGTLVYKEMSWARDLAHLRGSRRRQWDGPAPRRNVYSLWLEPGNPALAPRDRGVDEHDLQRPGSLSGPDGVSLSRVQRPSRGVAGPAHFCSHPVSDLRASPCRLRSLRHRLDRRARAWFLHAARRPGAFAHVQLRRIEHGRHRQGLLGLCPGAPGRPPRRRLLPRHHPRRCTAYPSFVRVAPRDGLLAVAAQPTLRSRGPTAQCKPCTETVGTPYTFAYPRIPAAKTLPHPNGP